MKHFLSIEIQKLFCYNTNTFAGMVKLAIQKFLGVIADMETSIEKIEIGLKKYIKIMSTLKKTDVSQDKDFQRLFNGFYRMRQQPANFYICFYQFLEQQKFNTNLTYPQVLTHLYNETGRIHASFSSKLLATVCPDMPVWDKHVLENLELQPPKYYEKNRFEKVVAIYNNICNWYQTQEAKSMIPIFEEYFPDANISNTKKIDLILWQTR